MFQYENTRCDQPKDDDTEVCPQLPLLTTPVKNEEETNVSSSDIYARELISNWQWFDKFGLRKNRNESTCLSWCGSINQNSDKPYKDIELAETRPQIPIDVRKKILSVIASRKLSDVINSITMLNNIFFLYF